MRKHIYSPSANDVSKANEIDDERLSDIVLESIALTFTMSTIHYRVPTILSNI